MSNGDTALCDVVPQKQAPFGEASTRPVLRWVLMAAFGVGGLLAMVSSIWWVVALVDHADQGLDASDEGYYLIHATDPHSAVARQSNFGSYLHVMLRASGGSLVGLRVSGIVVLLASTAAAAWGVGRWISVTIDGRQRAILLLGVWAFVSSVALTQYGLWLVTPSYNLLSQVFSLLAFAGVLSALSPSVQSPCRRHWWRFSPGLVLVGAVGVMLLDVKGTAGVATGALCFVLLACTVDRQYRASAASSILGGLLVGVLLAIAVAGSPVASVTSVARFARMLAIGKVYPASRVWETDFLVSTFLVWLAWFTALSIILALTWRRVRTLRVRVVVTAVAACVAALVLWDDHARSGTVGFVTNGWWWFRATAWTLLLTTAMAPKRSRQLVLGPLIALAAVTTALGSNNGLIRQTAFAAGLYALAVAAQAMIVVHGARPDPLRALPALVFVGVAGYVSFGGVSQAMHVPYRLGGSIERNTERVTIGSLGTVELTPEMAEYVTGLQEIGKLVPRDARNCLVDLSGGTPLSAMALGARSAALPWFFGGYPAAEAALAYTLGLASCTDGRVLLIDAPNGALRVELPAVLRGRAIRKLGEVHFAGYVDEIQVVSIIEPA